MARFHRKTIRPTTRLRHRIFGTRPQPDAKRRRRRLKTELLEDRRLLAVLVNNSFDGGLPSNIDAYGSARHQGQWVELTPAQNNRTGSLVVDNHGVRAFSFDVRFNQSIKDSTSSLPGDGLSFVYGPVPNGAWGNSGPGQTDGQAGPGIDGLVIKFDTFNGSRNNPGSIEVWYDKTRVRRVEGLWTDEVSNQSLRGTFKPTRVTINESGTLTLVHPALFTQYPGSTITVQIPNWDPASNWRFGFGASTGAANDRHILEDLYVNDRTIGYAPQVRYDTDLGDSGERIDDAGGTFVWQIKDRNGDLQDATITLQKETTTGAWTDVRSNTWSLTNWRVGAEAERSLELSPTDFADFGLGNYRTSITVNDQTSRSVTSISPVINVVDDDSAGPLITLTDHFGRSLSEVGVESSHGESPSINWDISDFQIFDGRNTDSGISSSSLIVTRNGTPFFTSTDVAGSLDLTGAGPGLYEVSLTASDNDLDHGPASSTDFSSTTVTGQLVLTNTPPSLQVGLDRAVREGEVVSYRVLSNSDADGDDLTYTWEFADNVSLMGESVEHTYTDDGVYDVVVTADDGFGGTTSDTFSVTVLNVAPRIIAVTTTPLAVDVNELVSLAVEVADVSDDPLTYEVDWDGDGIYDVENRSGSFGTSFASPGLKIFGVRVSDDEGDSTFTQAYVQVGPPLTDVPEVNFDIAGTTVSEGGMIAVTASILAPVNQDIAVPMTVSGNASTNDYTLDSQILVIKAGQKSGSLTVNLIDDEIDEETESLLLKMANPFNAVAGTEYSHAITIDDTDDVPTVWFVTSGQVIAEASSAITLTAQLSHPSSREVVVPLSLSGSASSPADYTLPAASVLRFAPETTFGYIDVEIADDATPEPNEIVILSMQSPDHGQLSNDPSVTDTFTLTIRQNDAPSVSFTKLYSEIGEEDSEIVLTAELSAAHSEPVDVVVDLSGSVDEQDVSSLSSVNLHFPAGETTATSSLTIDDDTQPEPQEFLVAKLASATGALVASPSTTVVGINDNDIPLVEFAVWQQSDYESTRTLPIEIKVSPVSPEEIIVPIELLAGSATLGSDYLFSTERIRVPAGTPSVTIDLVILEDSTQEANETVNLRIGQLENPTGADSIAQVGNQARHSVIIRNDDVRATLTVSQTYLLEDNASVDLEVNLSGVSDEPITAFISASGTAELGADYNFEGANANSTQIVIPPFQRSGSTRLNIHEDNILEFEELISLSFAASDVASSSIPQSQIRIGDDETGTVFFGTGYSEHSEGAGQFSIPVRLNAPAEFDVPVFILDARKGETELVVIPAGLTSADYVTHTDNDSSLDVTKHVFFSIVGAIGVEFGSTTRHEAVIIDDDRRSGYWGELEYSHFINKRGYDEWIEHVEGFDPAGAFLEVWSYLANDAFQTAVCSALGTTAGVGSIVWTGGVGAFASTAVAASTTAVCKQIVGDVITIEADRDGGVQVESEVVNQLKQSVATFPSDGPIVGYRGFFDANKNLVADFVDFDNDGFQDANEPAEPYFDVTSSGMMYGEIPIDFDQNNNGIIESSEGQLVVTGGVDLSTNLQLTLPLTAPLGSRVLNPLTTLVSELVNSGAYDIPAAVDRVLAGFELPQFDLLRRDPIIRADSGDVAAALVFARGGMLHNSAKQVAMLLSGLTNAPSERELGHAFYSEIASAISNDDEIVDLNNRYVVQSLLQSVANQFGLTIDDTLLVVAADTIAEGNSAISSLPVDASIQYMESVAQVQIVSQGTVATLLKEASRGQRPLSEVQAATTGSSLRQLIDAAIPGTLLIPEIEITNGELLEGDTGEQFMEFTVSLSNAGKEPITVRYSTVDVNDAASDLDYGLAYGHLHWEAGDASERKIQVPIYGDTQFEGQEEFELWLDAPEGAVISRQGARGIILEDDPFSYTAPSDGTSNRIQVDVYDGNRVVVLRNDQQVLNTPVSHTQQITISGAEDVENEFIVSAAAANLFPTDGISIIGGNQQDSILVRNDLSSTIVHEIESLSAGVFSFDGNAIAYSRVETLNDTWTPELTGIWGNWFEGSGVELGLDYTNAFYRSGTSYAWTVNHPVGKLTESDDSSVSFVSGDNGTASIDLAITIPSGPQISLSFQKPVLNVDPSAEIVSISQILEEGTTIDVTSTVSDPAASNDVLTLSYAVHKDGELYDEQIDVGLTAYSFTPDDNGSYEIVFTVSDEDGGSTAVSKTITVGNVAPSVVSLENVTFGSPVAAPNVGGVVGQNLQFRGVFADAGISDTHTATVDWGDGSDLEPLVPTQQAGGGSVAGEHIFEKAGTYRVTITVTDSDGETNLFDIEVVVTTSALLPDTWNPELSALYAGGTTSADDIEIRSGAESGTIEVWINDVLDGVFAPAGRLVIFGQAGDDDIQVAGSINHDTWIDGGEGDDRIKGGAGNDVIMGGQGHDLLLGRSGRDFLLGGRGSDRIVGNRDDDILIVGWLAFDDQRTALTSVMNEWTSKRSYQERLEKLADVLVLGGTVLDDDNDKDKLTGSAGDDWFFFDQDNDRATDLKDEVFANDLSWILS
ncbi:PKD domain-containing protein [Stieleria sp. ICT_E10.1]|uniref:Calx-beta domain-containing protein n=1 Tax=Stieleria sedimenti TaxID=2976331 RepID=UPI00217FA7EA|nr:Calx-beta domain-containing protein [Stieleria sedimenti]MCS7470620.1 PKD domain-containing protein [Stieleria sedimenti]